MKIQSFLLVTVISLACFAGGFWLGPRYTIKPNPYFKAMRDSDHASYRSRSQFEDVALTGDAAKIRKVLLNPDVLVRMKELSAELMNLGPGSIEEVQEAFDTVFLDIGDVELILFAEWWARFDPHAALDWCESDWRADHRRVAIQILRAWGESDPGAALARVAQGGAEKPFADHDVMAVIPGWEMRDPMAALSYLQSLGPNITRQRMLENLARRRVLRYGIDDSFAFAKALPDDDELFKLNVIRRIVSVSAKLDAKKTADFTASLQGSPYFHNVPQRVVIPWVRTDPIAAVEWLASLEDSDSRDNGVRMAFRKWRALDMKAAGHWLTDTEHEKWRDHAMALYARAIQLADNDEGIALAEKIFDDELRQATLTMILRVWSKFDAAAANKYADREGWTEQEKNRALAIAWRQRAFELNRLEREQGTGVRQIEERMDRDLVEADFEEASGESPRASASEE